MIAQTPADELRAAAAKLNHYADHAPEQLAVLITADTARTLAALLRRDARIEDAFARSARMDRASRYESSFVQVELAVARQILGTRET